MVCFGPLYGSCRGYNVGYLVGIFYVTFILED